LIFSNLLKYFTKNQQEYIISIQNDIFNILSNLFCVQAYCDWRFIPQFLYKINIPNFLNEDYYSVNNFSEINKLFETSNFNNELSKLNNLNNGDNVLNSISYSIHDGLEYRYLFRDDSEAVSYAFNEDFDIPFMLLEDFEFDNINTIVDSTPDVKLYYPEPFIASPSFVHEDFFFMHILYFQHWLWFFFYINNYVFFYNFYKYSSLV